MPRGFGEDVVTHPVVVITTTTNYMTMPAGTYTETISEGAIKVIVVVDATATSKVECPAECDCSRIKDKESDEYVVNSHIMHDLGVSPAFEIP